MASSKDNYKIQDLKKSEGVKSTSSARDQLVQELTETLADYLLENKLNKLDIKIVPVTRKSVVNEVLQSKDDLSFGFFSSGDTGVKRAIFLYRKLKEWANDETLTERKFIETIYQLAVSTADPPKGLGSSVINILRIRIYETLAKKLGIMEEAIIERKRFVIKSLPGGWGSRSRELDPDRVLQYLIGEKLKGEQVDLKSTEPKKQAANPS